MRVTIDRQPTPEEMDEIAIRELARRERISATKRADGAIRKEAVRQYLEKQKASA